MYGSDDGKMLRSVRKLKRSKNEVIVAVPEHSTRGSAYGTITLGRAFTKRMGGKTLIVMRDDTQVLKIQVPEDVKGRLEARIERW